VGKETEQDFPLQTLISQMFILCIYPLHLCDRPDLSACSHCLVPIWSFPPDLTSGWAQNKKLGFLALVGNSQKGIKPLVTVSFYPQVKRWMPSLPFYLSMKTFSF